MLEISNFPKERGCMLTSLINLARNLKDYRARRGLTQKELADKAGINRSYLASLESGIQSNTSIRTVEKLAKALDVTVVDLLKPISKKEQRQ